MPDKPKNLAELKRYLQPGVEVWLIRTYGLDRRWDRQHYVVERQLARGVDLQPGVKSDPISAHFFFEWPKAGSLRFNEQGFEHYRTGKEEPTNIIRYADPTAPAGENDTEEGAGGDRVVPESGA